MFIAAPLIYGNNTANMDIKKRPATKVKMQVSPTEYQEVNIPEMPYVENGNIHIVVSETLYIEFDIINDKLVNPRYVENVKERTLILKLTQDYKGTILKIENPFSRVLTYKCLLQNYNENKFRETHVLPVEPKFTNYEGWPNTVCQLVIYDVALK